MLSVNLSPFTELSTERLILRRVEKTDAEDLFALRSDVRMMKYLGRPMATSIDDAVKMIDLYNDALEKNEGITWAVALKDTGKMIGTIGFWRIDKVNHRAEIGYMLHADYWGKGLMHEAIVTALHYAFTHLKFHSIEAHANPENTASLHILEKNGFVREAYFKE
ncbi:MAG: GNAT family N-acetyltransferase, partial [Flavobacteriales bacterium]